MKDHILELWNCTPLKYKACDDKHDKELTYKRKACHGASCVFQIIHTPPKQLQAELLKND